MTVKPVNAPVQLSPVKTLGDFYVSNPRCSRCGLLLPASAKVEEYPTAIGNWILVKCPECKRQTPFPMERVL